MPTQTVAQTFPTSRALLELYKQDPDPDINGVHAAVIIQRVIQEYEHYRATHP